MSLSRIVRAAVLTAFLPAVAFAHAGSSAISGVVKDDSGAAVPVTLRMSFRTR